MGASRDLWNNSREAFVQFLLTSNHRRQHFALARYDGGRSFVACRFDGKKVHDVNYRL
jgi:hypothetical protein